MKYDFTIKYKKSKENKRANTLSYRVNYIKGIVLYKETLFRETIKGLELDYKVISLGGKVDA